MRHFRRVTPVPVLPASVLTGRSPKLVVSGERRVEPKLDSDARVLVKGNAALLSRVKRDRRGAFVYVNSGSPGGVRHVSGRHRSGRALLSAQRCLADPG